MGKEKKEKFGDVFKCPPTKPTLQFLSLYLVPGNTLLQAPKKVPSSSLSLHKTNIFRRAMWAFWVSLYSWSEFHRENREGENFLTPLLYLYLICVFLSFGSLTSLLPLRFVSFLLPFFLFLFCLDCSIYICYYSPIVVGS